MIDISFKHVCLKYVPLVSKVNSLHFSVRPGQIFPSQYCLLFHFPKENQTLLHSKFPNISIMTLLSDKALVKKM